MKPRQNRSEDPINRSLIFLILRFAVFLLIALTISTTFEAEKFLPLWGALGYFALSEIVLLIRPIRWIQQSIAAGVYFLDVYAVSSLILLQGLSVMWYLTLPALMLGVGLCYHRRGSWFIIALVPSVLILYQLFQSSSFTSHWTWELLGIVFLFFVFAAIVHAVVGRMDSVLFLYQGQRHLVHGISGLAPLSSMEECLQRILGRETPIEVDYCTLLFRGTGGRMEGSERIRRGKQEKVFLPDDRIPPAFESVIRSETYIPNLRKERDDKVFFQQRGVKSLFGRPLKIEEKTGMIVFGKKAKDGFSPGETEILSTYAEMMGGWMRQSCHYQQQEAVSEGIIVEDYEPAGDAVESTGSVSESRLLALEQENLKLKESLDEQVHTATLELKKAVLSLVSKESEKDRQVFEKLASVELGQAVSSLFDLDLILELIVEVICEKLSVRTASIMLLSEDRKELVVHAYRGMQDEIARKTRLMVGEAIAGYVAEKGEPLLIEDIENDPRFVPFRKDRYRSGTLLCVPILHAGQALGVINLSDPEREGPFEDSDLEVVQALSRQAAIATVNHRLYQEFKNGQWIRELYEEGLSRKLSEKVFQDVQVLEKMEGNYRISILSVSLHEKESTPQDSGDAQRIHRINRTLQTIREAIVSHRGDIATDSGGGVIGIFGLPFPGGQDPWRAVHAAVDLLKRFTRSGDAAESNGFGISVGVTTGDLLLQEKKGGGAEAVFGEAWRRAVILMHAGSSGQILVDEETFDAIQGRVHGLRLALPYGIHKQMTVYGIKGLKRVAS